HSTWLDLWLQLGLVGLGISIVGWIMAARNAAWLLIFSNRDEAVFWSALLLNLAFRSLTETNIVSPGTIGMFTLGLGYAGLARLAEAEFAAQRRARAPRNPL